MTNLPPLMRILCACPQMVQPKTCTAWSRDEDLGISVNKFVGGCSFWIKMSSSILKCVLLTRTYMYGHNERWMYTCMEKCCQERFQLLWLLLSRKCSEERSRVELWCNSVFFRESCVFPCGSKMRFNRLESSPSFSWTCVAAFVCEGDFCMVFSPLQCRDLFLLFFLGGGDWSDSFLLASDCVSGYAWFVRFFFFFCFLSWRKQNFYLRSVVTLFSRVILLRLGLRWNLLHLWRLSTPWIVEKIHRMCRQKGWFLSCLLFEKRLGLQHVVRPTFFEWKMVKFEARVWVGSFIWLFQSGVHFSWEGEGCRRIVKRWKKRSETTVLYIQLYITVLQFVIHCYWVHWWSPDPKNSVLWLYNKRRFQAANKCSSFLRMHHLSQIDQDFGRRNQIFVEITLHVLIRIYIYFGTSEQKLPAPPPKKKAKNTGQTSIGAGICFRTKQKELLVETSGFSWSSIRRLHFTKRHVDVWQLHKGLGDPVQGVRSLTGEEFFSADQNKLQI